MTPLEKSIIKYGNLYLKCLENDVKEGKITEDELNKKRELFNKNKTDNMPNF